MSKTEMKKIACPGCGKDLHYIHVPSKPGEYRLSCQGEPNRYVIVTVHEDGTITGKMITVK